MCALCRRRVGAERNVMCSLLRPRAGLGVPVGVAVEEKIYPYSIIQKELTPTDSFIYVHIQIYLLIYPLLYLMH